MSSDDDEILDTTIFQEPNDYFQPEKPCTYTDYILLSGEKLHMRLVGHNPLWVPTYELTLKTLTNKLTNSPSRATTSGTAAKSSPPTSNSTPPP